MSLRRIPELLMIPAFAALALAGSAHAAAPPHDYKIAPVPLVDVRFTDTFWSPRLETNHRVTVWYDFRKCEETGRIDNFAKAGRLTPGDFRGIFFDDSDVFKVIEGASYALAKHPDAKLDKYLDELIAKIAAAQEPDGYLYTARTLRPDNPPIGSGKTRWSNLAASHELYNVGHLYEAAVAHYQATGKRTLLDVAIKNANLIDTVFGPGGRHDVPGHEEIEIGLVKLFRTTGDERYLKLAKFFIHQRGHAHGRKLYGPYAQDHVPLVEQTEAVGHAVRAGYLYAGAADVAALTGDEALRQALERIWQNVVSKKLAITGGLGAVAAARPSATTIELPNAESYNETCAAIAGALWNHRMFLLEGDARYIDVLERIVYNGFLSGVSLSGDRFFYVNPLACDGRSRFNQGTMGRSPWFTVSCCPVNVVRFLPSMAGYVYASRQDTVYVNLYIGGSATIRLPDNTLRLSQRTEYPWQGRVELTVEPEKPGGFELRLRIPGWATARRCPATCIATRNPPRRRCRCPSTARRFRRPQMAVMRRSAARGNRATPSLSNCPCRCGECWRTRRSPRRRAAWRSSAGRSCTVSRRSITAAACAIWYCRTMRRCAANIAASCWAA